MNVLIVHRHESFIEGIRQKFISSGWLVQSSISGLDGLLLARHRSFDLILCGLDLPVISGTELIRSLRNLSMNENTPAYLLSRTIVSPEMRLIADKLKAAIITEKDLNGYENILAGVLGF